jgi:hypothetical protein
VSEKHSPEKMLLKILRVAEILVKSTNLQSKDKPKLQYVQNEVDKSQNQDTENTKE